MFLLRIHSLSDYISIIHSMSSAISTEIDLEFLRIFYQSLASAGIAYGILRNAEEVEAGDAHDVDMTVDATRQQETETLLYATAHKLGWQLHLKTGSAGDKYDIKCYHFFKEVGGETDLHLIHIDIFPVFSWNACILIDNEGMLADGDKEGLFRRIAPAAEAVSKLFVRLLYSDYVKEKYRPSIQQMFAEHAEAVKTTLRRFLKEETAAWLMGCVSAGQWAEIEAARKKLIREITSLAPTYRWHHRLYLAGKAVRRAGMMIAFEGTDGSGKSTIINGLPEVLGHTFPADAVFYYHCRPYVLQPSKAAHGLDLDAACPEPHAEKPYGKLKSLVKLLFCVADYALGYWLKVRWQVAKGKLVIFDRYYYDFYLDKIRYRMGLGDTWFRLFQWMVPKPDATFVLTGEAEPIWQRKKELPLEEVQRQIDTLEKHKSHFAHPVTINVVRPIPEVVGSVAAAMLRTMAARFSCNRQG